MGFLDGLLGRRKPVKPNLDALFSVPNAAITLQVSSDLLPTGLVYTNIVNLPAADENQHVWVRDLCAMCRKCLRECPVTAIYETPQEGAAGQVTFVDHPKCLAKFSTDYGCSVCVKVCPFSNVGYATIKSRFKGTKHGQG